MKKLIVSIVMISILYFVLGFVAVLLGWFPKETYLNLSGIMGGLASVCGLLAFGISRKISKEDFEDIESSYLKKISQTADKLKEKNDELVNKAKQINNTEEELRKLEIRKGEMEFLVKKASLSLFIQDQLDRNQKRILELVDSNPELKRLLDENEPLKKRLLKLTQEIKTDPNVELLNDIITSARREKESILRIKPSIFGMGIDIKQLLRTINKIMTS